MKYVYGVVSAVSIGVPTVPIASEMKNEMKQTTRTIDAVASWHAHASLSWMCLPILVWTSFARNLL